MLLVYMSLSGNVRKFVKEVGWDSLEFSYSNPFLNVDKEYMLVMPSYSDEITDIVSDFIDYGDNLKHLVAIIGSGNMNFGKDGYCFNASEIAKEYNKPLIFKFEHSGDSDIENFKKEVEEFEITRIKQ